MDIKALINEKIQRLQDLNRQMEDVSKKIGTFQEQGRALHGAALQLKGAIEGLAELEAKEEAEKAEKAKGLVLPDKSLVAPDGKTVIADVNATPAAPAAEATPEAPKAPVTLEVQ